MLLICVYVSLDLDLCPFFVTWLSIRGIIILCIVSFVISSLCVLLLNSCCLGVGLVEGTCRLRVGGGFIGIILGEGWFRVGGVGVT